MGIYRYLLASAVVLEHLTEGNPYFSHVGMFAVFGFYVLSGFLITKVLNDVYEFRFVPFWLNRILRLYPPYFVVFLIGIAIIFGLPGAADFFPAVWKSRPEPADWIGLITIFPTGVRPMEWTFRPVPSIWSVGVELLNYAVLFLVGARNKRNALLLLVGAVGYHIYSLCHGDDLGFRYFPFFAALLPFALGALIYFTVRPAQGIAWGLALLMCLPAAGNTVAAALLGGAQKTPLFESLFYLDLLFQCLAVAALSSMKAIHVPRLDKVMGDLSYPIFLCHWLVGYLIALFFFNERRGISLMIFTLMAATGFSWVLCKLQNRIVEPMRSRIRTGVDSPRMEHGVILSSDQGGGAALRGSA